jgi:hypothetical protein
MIQPQLTVRRQMRQTGGNLINYFNMLTPLQLKKLLGNL